MTAAVTPEALTIAGYPIEALAFAPSTYRREMAETLALLPAPDQVTLVTRWFLEAIPSGATWNPPALPGNHWGPLEGELTLFGMTAFGTTLEEAVTSWIKHVRRSEQAMEDAA
jgi:hypothetical protein